MIDPFNITKYDRTIEELQEFFLFVAFVPSKSATRTAKNLEILLSKAPSDLDPFDKIKYFIKNNILRKNLEDIGFGQYNKLEKCMKELTSANLDLKTCSVEDLECIHGISYKSSRFFILHSRKNARIACLDVHILRYLSSLGWGNIPKTTPTRGKYLKIEEEFLKLADINNISPADLDLKIWSMYAKGSKNSSLIESDLILTEKES